MFGILGFAFLAFALAGPLLILRGAIKPRMLIKARISSCLLGYGFSCASIISLYLAVRFFPESIETSNSTSPVISHDAFGLSISNGIPLMMLDSIILLAVLPLYIRHGTNRP